MAHPDRRELLKRRGALIAARRGETPQDVCALRAGIHQTTWSGYERGAHDMALDKALRIAPVLGITVTELLSGEVAEVSA